MAALLFMNWRNCGLCRQNPGASVFPYKSYATYSSYQTYNL